MPVYEYKCTICHKITTLFTKNNYDLDIINCSFCGNKAKRIISKLSKPILKGKGFYETDYKKGDQK